MRLHSTAEGQGKPLIILHGFLGSLDNWQTMSRRLARFCRVHSLDLRNHGRSPHSDVMNYEAMADDVHEFAAEHNLETPFLLGHSMGGKVAMQFAARFPERIEKLIVVDIAPRAYPPAHLPLLRAMRNVALSAYKSFADVDAVLSADIPDTVVRQFILKNLARDLAGKLYWRLGLDEIIQNYGNLTDAVAAEKPFRKPACFIRAGRSDFVQDGDLPAIRKLFPRAEFKSIAHAGHWVHIDAADEFQTTVTDFLALRGKP